MPSRLGTSAGNSPLIGLRHQGAKQLEEPVAVLKHGSVHGSTGPRASAEHPGRLHR
jgi:hypothetical protein